MTAAEALDADVDLTLQQVAELTNLSTDALRRAIRKGDLQAAKLCGQIRVEAAELRRKAANRIRPRVDGSPMLDVRRQGGGLFRERLNEVERRERGAQQGDPVQRRRALGGAYRDSDRDSSRRRRRFIRKGDAQRFETEIRRRRQLGDLAGSRWSRRTVSELAADWFDLYAVPNLAKRTRRDYQVLLDRHVIPRLGNLKLRDVSTDVIDRFKRDLERQGTGRSQTRQALAVLRACSATRRSEGGSHAIPFAW